MVTRDAHGASLEIGMSSPGLAHAEAPGLSLLGRVASYFARMFHRATARRIGDLSTVCVVVVSYLLIQSDRGIQGDAHIYLGRALADLDPQGVGRDVMFVHDGQSAYSVFRFVARFALAHFGLERTSQALDFAAALAWLAAMAALVSTLRPRRAFALVVGAAVLLPRWYAPWSGLGAGEALAVPRPFAEALVLLSFALLARQRILGSGVALCLAAALHPIMALPGFGVLLVVLIARDRRWAFAAAAATALVAGIAAYFGTPLFGRALVVIDPLWLSILQDRLQYLFVSRWPVDAFAAPLLQLMTIAIASTLVRPPASTILRAAAVIAVVGFALSALLCDGFHLLLFAQAQLWRSLWLVAALAPLSLGICVWRLPSRGAREFAALAALVAAWTCVRLQPAGAFFALLAVAILTIERLTASRASRVAIFAFTGAGVILSVAIDVAYAPRGDLDAASNSIVFVWHLTIWPLAVLAFAAIVARQPNRTQAWIAAPLSVALATALAAGYDDRSALKADRDAGRMKADLVARLASRPGEVLWLGGDELWYWTRRANWNSSLQGAAIVFSRDLAIVWHDRAEALVSRNLASQNYTIPWASDVVHRPHVYDRPAIDDLCRRSDAPAWVVVPVAANDPVTTDVDVQIWVPPFADRLAAPRRLIVPCHPI